MNKLSVVLATRNEEKNIGDCLSSIKNIADEIIIVDEESTDNTKKIAESFGAKVYTQKHEPIFHITKQKALDLATCEWILQLDADERVTSDLSKEIKEVINMKSSDIKKRFEKFGKRKLFFKHQKLIEEREGTLGNNKEIVAFFIPRKNFFLGEPIIHAGVYPDGVIRLVKKGKARFPAKSVHEQMIIDGGVSWLQNHLEHYDSPTLKRYFQRLNRYTDLHAQELKERNTPKNIFYMFHYCLIKKCFVFLNIFIRHKGFLDGYRGFLWSLFSSWHYPIAYFKYWQMK